ncbi:hypothetical protein ACSBR2_032647 [Camellia fascicularis]
MKPPVMDLSLFLLVTFHAILVPFLCLSLSGHASAAIIGNVTDKLALLEFKSRLTEDPVGVLDSWNDSLDLCRWTGVKCGLKHRRITVLDLEGKELVGTTSPHIGNLSFLKILNLANNSFFGGIPSELGHLIRLQTLNLSSNFLGRDIPVNLSQCSNLINLALNHNLLEREIPPELGSSSKLANLNLGNNNLIGRFPASLGNLSSLQQLFLWFSGCIPSSLANISNLLQLDFPFNNFTGSIPVSFGILQNLSSLNLPNNILGSSAVDDLSFLTSLANCSKLQMLDFSRNQFGGQLSASVANLSTQLTWLNIQRNNIRGSIPPETANLINLDAVGMGQNLLTGHIPPQLGSLSNLVMLYLKNNNLTGTVPASIGNLTSLQELYLSCNYNLEDETIVAVKVLNLQQRGASKSFIAECQALKNIRHRNLVKIVTACSSIDFEGNDFKALVYEYMLNGSLEKWLHSEEGQSQQRSLSILQRMNIAIDVASALDYLHNHCEIPVPHCDLKPSNVFLDNDFTAHVSDFGLAQLLCKFSKEATMNQFSSLGIKGTIGYAAPEYGMGSKASMQGDVYSFGILLLEMFTGKRPADIIFKNGLNLHRFTKMALPERVMEIADPSLLLEVGGDDDHVIEIAKTKECLVAVLTIGVSCSMESLGE